MPEVTKKPVPEKKVPVPAPKKVEPPPPKGTPPPSTYTFFIHSFTRKIIAELGFRKLYKLVTLTAENVQEFWYPLFIGYKAVFRNKDEEKC